MNQPGQEEQQGAAPQGDGTNTTASADTDASGDEGSGGARVQVEGDDEPDPEEVAPYDGGDAITLVDINGNEKHYTFVVQLEVGDSRYVALQEEGESEDVVHLFLCQEANSEGGPKFLAIPEEDFEAVKEIFECYFVEADQVEALTVTLTDDETGLNTTYNILASTMVGGLNYVALRPVEAEEGSESVYFRITQSTQVGVGDDYEDKLPEDELGPVREAFARIFAVEKAADESEAENPSRPVTPKLKVNSDEAAEQG